MNVNLLQKKSIRLLFGLFLAFVLIAGKVETAKAQFDRPQLPRLSLSGNDQWDTDWYPDGKIWLPASANGPREFLMPVFVDNRWHVYQNTANIYQPDPIKSFSFTVQYNYTAIRPVGVETSWPMKDAMLQYLPLANKFQISWYDFKDWSYGKYLEPTPPFDTYSKGRSVTITGTSTEPLPTTDLQSEQFQVMLYIRFRVIPQDGASLGNAQFSPIYIKTDTIMWNDYNIRQDAPFKYLRPQYNGRDVTTDYPDPNQVAGLAGVDNSSTNIWPRGWRMLPGVIYLNYSDNVPAFGWKLQRGLGTIPPVNELMDNQNNTMIWNMMDPITVDSGSTVPLYGSRIIQIENKVSTSRILDVELESDQPWLTFRTKAGTSLKNIIVQPTRHGYINWLDNGILGDAARGTPLPTISTTTDGEVQLEIRCNPALLNDPPSFPSAEQCGIYVGYITLKSSTALINPIKIRITFIYFRTPIEVNQLVQKAPGININLYNSHSPAPDSCNIIFGTGYRATSDVDTLFGEYAYDYDMKSFEARWFPPKNSNPALIAKVPYGFGDFAPDDDNNDGTPKRSNSRDIRSNTDTNQSITYYCKIREDLANDYPIVLQWDAGDFPDGAQLFLKDAVNGLYFPDIDMRKANPLGPTQRSFTIQDARVKEFIIEYTLPKVIDYVDEYGNPIIKTGWNLLSLPVRPINAKWSVVYPNAMNRPIAFTQNTWQDNDQLQVGVGYWIKYSNSVDTKFAGTFINTISVTGTPYDSIRIFPGWNTIGACSAVMNVSDIAFSPWQLDLPSQNYVRGAGIWGYTTNLGYKEVSEIRPGLGYWLKADQHGFLSLIVPNHKISMNDYVSPREAGYEQSAKLNLIDNAQNHTDMFFGGKNINESLYELPPTPPDNVFDARFTQGTILTTANSSVIQLQGVSYPVSLNMTNADANYKFVDAVTNEDLGVISKGSNGSLELRKAGSGYIKVLKTDAGNSSSYLSLTANTVQNGTTVNFGVIENSNVTIQIYNELGVVVETLVNGSYNTGEYSQSLNTSGYTSGNYFVRMINGNNSAVQTLTIIK